jgi:hypothetical protein
LFNVFFSDCSATSAGGGLYVKLYSRVVLRISGNVVFSSCTSQYGGGIFCNDYLGYGSLFHFGEYLSFIDCNAEIGKNIIIQSNNFDRFFSSSSSLDYNYDSYFLEGQNEFFGYDGIDFVDLREYLCTLQIPGLIIFFFYWMFMSF